MKRSVSIPAFGAAAITAAAVLAAPVAAVPPQQSVTVPTQCWALSPNLVDIPYSGAMKVSQERSGVIDVHYGNPSLWGYQTAGTIAWLNLRTGRSGEVSFWSDRGPSSGGVWKSIRTGAGTVLLTSSGESYGAFLTLKAPVCSGRVQVR